MTQPAPGARDPASLSRYWLIFGGIALAGLMVLCTVAFFVNRESDPRPYIQDHYERAVSLDEPDGGQAYTSTKSPESVVEELRDNTREHGSGFTDGVHFLQYDDDIVAVSAAATGSKIYIDDYRTGHHRYSGLYAGFGLLGWSSTPPGSGGYRGGGPDGGK